MDLPQKIIKYNLMFLLLTEYNIFRFRKFLQALHLILAFIKYFNVKKRLFEILIKNQTIKIISTYYTYTTSLNIYNTI